MKKHTLRILLLAAVLILGLVSAALADTPEPPQGLSLRQYENGVFTGPYLTKLTHGYNTTKTYGVFLDGTQQTTFTVEESDFYTAIKAQDGLVTLTINSRDSEWEIWFRFEETNRQSVEFRYEQDTRTHSFTYNGTNYTLIFGPERSTNPVHVADSWFGMDTSAPGQGMIAAVYQNYGEDGQQPAPDEIQKLITNVTLSVTDDDNGCMTVEQAVQQPAGWWQGKALVSSNKVAGDGYITANITINGEQVTLRAVGRVFVPESADVTHVAGGTPAENMTSLQQTVDSLNLQGKTATLYLTPGAIYEGTLKIQNRGDLSGLTIKGGMDEQGNPTVIRGEVQLHNAITGIEDLCFAAPEKTGPTFGIDHKKSNAAAWWIRNCAFLGYTVAVNCTTNGYTLPISHNLFVNNKTAVRFECGPTNMIEPNTEMTNSVFLHNDVAIEIVSLPDTVARYEFRVRSCDFINNQKDFIVPQGETYPYYFHENYFGDTTGNGKAHGRGAICTGNIAHEIRQINPVSFRWGPDTCWWQDVKLTNGFLFHSNQPAVLSEETASNVLVETLNTLNYKLEIVQGGGLTILDDSASTELLNSDAENLTLGSDALDDVTLQVNDLVDGTETAIGTWTFE